MKVPKTDSNEDKLEQLRRLKLVKYHRQQNDLTELRMLTEKWREAGHRALHELHSLINQEPKPSCKTILRQFGIDPSHIDCDSE